MTVHATRESQALAELRFLADALGVPRPGPAATWTVVIERDTNPNNRAAIESLAASRRTWRNACLDLGISARDWHEVAPQTWAGPCGLLGATGKAMGSTKEASVQLARAQFRIEPKSDDEADACLLGGWFLREGGAEGQHQRDEARKARKDKRGSGRWSPEDLTAHLARMGR